MTFKLGSTDINLLSLGSTEIKQAYLGSTLIHDTTAADTVPATMVDANWSVASGSEGEVDLTVASAPDNGGATITKYQYTTDDGSTWLDTGLTAIGTIALTQESDTTAFVNETSYAFKVRAVNSVGNGLKSNEESASAGAVAVGGLISTNLKALWEMDNTTVAADHWIDEIAGVDLSVQSGMVAPELVSAGTPTGLDHYAFGPNDGLGTISLSGVDIPDGAEARTMYAVVAYGTGPHNYNGILYGTATTNQAFGFVADPGDDLNADFWGSSVDGTTTTIDDATFHVIAIVYDGSTITTYIDNVVEATGTSITLGTVLSRFYIHEGLNGAGKSEIMDCCAIAVYAGDHDATDRTQMFDYLNDKYIGA